jgi:ribonuclease HI
MWYPELVLHFDGGCGPQNPGGLCTFGWHLDKPRGQPVHDGAGVCDGLPLAQRTNNVAEYHALCDGLAWMRENGVRCDRLTVCGDSRLVIMQLTGRWKCKTPHLAPLLQEATRGLHAACPSRGPRRWAARWIPRKLNGKADALARRAFDLETVGRVLPCR